MKRKPKKPTNPYGFISFSKNGHVKKQMNMLSNVKDIQENQVMETFIKQYNECSKCENKITSYRQLEENNQDFLIELGGNNVEIQLTELIDREFYIPLTLEQYKECSYDESLFDDSSSIPKGVDCKKRDLALIVAIVYKIEKKYSKSKNSPLWLVIFTTTLYLVEAIQNGKRTRFPSFIIALEVLRQMKNHIFDEIWFTNLLSSPIKIWPEES